MTRSAAIAIGAVFGPYGLAARLRPPMEFTVLLVLLIAVLAGAITARAAEPGQFTAAENALFVDDHLAGLEAPAKLNYRYSRTGSLLRPLRDQASVRVEGASTERIATVSFLSGKDKLELPPFQGVRGNPVLLYFLEREIREMKRLTGGSVNYYRKRLRMALATDPDVRQVTIEYQGRQVSAQEIRISPYRTDPARVRYEKFAPKTFRIVLSKSVPGRIVSLQSELRIRGRADGELLVAETLRFEGTD